MKSLTRKLLLLAALLGCLLGSGCQNTQQAELPQLYIYGEQHGENVILQKELELWQGYYNEANLRHLFVELPSYTADFLNVWMQAENDAILEQLYADWQGTALYDSNIREFYQQIKATCPETIFHGVDVGHQWETTGQRYLEYCQASGLTDSAAYKRALANIEQGQIFYDNQDYSYREEMLTQNFSQCFNELGNESIMGIFGAAHTVPEQPHTMAAGLLELYGEQLHCESLLYLLLAEEPLRYDQLNINGKEYQAAYFGSQDISSVLPNFASREFWRLEQAYADFKACPANGDVLPYDNYPMQVENGQVFLVKYTRQDGGTEEHYYRADGNSWQGRPATEEFLLD